MNDDALRAQLRGLPVFDAEPPPLDTDEVPDHPAELFLDWLLQAIDAGVREPHAMTLSTVDTAGHPNSRVLILKGLADGHWQFASSGESRKGQELAKTPWAAASFYWSEVGRQVRIRGRVLDGGAEAAARDFLARPDGSRAESLAGSQSQILQDPPTSTRRWKELSCGWRLNRTSYLSTGGSITSCRATSSSGKPTIGAATCGCATDSTRTAGPANCSGHDNQTDRPTDRPTDWLSDERFRAGRRSRRSLTAYAPSPPDSGHAHPAGSGQDVSCAVRTGWAGTCAAATGRGNARARSAGRNGPGRGRGDRRHPRPGRSSRRRPPCRIADARRPGC